MRLRWTGDNGAVRGMRSYGYTRGDDVQGSFSYPVFEALRDANETLAGLFAVPETPLTLVVDGRAEVATGFAATGDYFSVLGVRPVAGRTIGPDDDRPGAEPVAMINAAAAAELFGTENAVGRRFGFDQEERGEIEVVGVARDNRYDDLRGAVPPTVLRSAVQSPLRAATFAVRTGGPPNALTPAVREAVRHIDPRGRRADPVGPDRCKTSCRRPVASRLAKCKSTRESWLEFRKEVPYHE